MEDRSMKRKKFTVEIIKLYVKRNSSTVYAILKYVYKGGVTLAWLPILSYYLIRNKIRHDIVFCECSVLLRCFSVKKNNWGDDINKYFMEYATGKKFVFIPYNSLLFKRKIQRYSMIGSIIGFYDLNNMIIYGSGIIDPNITLVGTPIKIISVRGPQTQKALLRQNYLCPERYGDPALLLPYFYKPNPNRRNGVCIIPNMGTKNTDLLMKMKEEYKCEIIDMTRYKKWTDVIDKIVSSKFVLSESLHGLIVAETYGIPNIWVEFQNHGCNWDFKFLDYYASIGKDNMKSIKLYEAYNWDKICEEVDNWKKGTINYLELIELFPFKMSPKIREE